jgi:hypothetical protein
MPTIWKHNLEPRYKLWRITHDHQMSNLFWWATLETNDLFFMPVILLFHKFYTNEVTVVVILSILTPLSCVQAVGWTHHLWLSTADARFLIRMATVYISHWRTLGLKLLQRAMFKPFAHRVCVVTSSHLSVRKAQNSICWAMAGNLGLDFKESGQLFFRRAVTYFPRQCIRTSLDVLTSIQC